MLLETAESGWPDSWLRRHERTSNLRWDMQAQDERRGLVPNRCATEPDTFSGVVSWHRPHARHTGAQTGQIRKLDLFSAKRPTLRFVCGDWHANQRSPQLASEGC